MLVNQKIITPQTHIFLWDLHDVILTKSFWAWFVVIVTFKRKGEIIRRLNKKTMKILFIFMAECLKLTKKQMISEELLFAAQEANNTALIDLIVTMCSTYVPIKNTLFLIQELSYLGYKHHLGSNIGETVFVRSAEQFSTIFSLFEAFSIPFLSQSKIIKKPNPDFFIAHAEKSGINLENIIFIDDKLVNIIAARSVGMHAIHFKNPAQLRKQLIDWKIITTH